MGATKLIEEAEMLCAVASAAKSGAVSLAGVLYEQDRDFIVGARTLVPELAAALKASEESLQDARAELAPRIACIGRMEEERRALQSANLAANKRIVELEHERDAARAELARLTTPRPIAEAPRDGAWVLCKSSAGWKEGQFCGLNFDPPNCLGWFGRDNRELRRVTDYLPLPEVKP